MVTSTTSTTATRSLVTALGGGSGIDMVALANDLAIAQFAGRTDRLTARSETLERQISAASSLKGMLYNLATSLGERIRVGDLSPQPQLANASVAQATLSGGVQPKGSYSLEVTALATSQVLSSPPYAAATDPVGAGTLTLRFGTVSGASFTEDTAHAPVAVTIASGATLADVAAAINGSGAGVSAYVAKTVDGAKLVLKGAQGGANGFILEATETPGEEGLANLTWTPAAPAGRLTATAADAAFKIDGLAMTSPANSVANAIPGVNLKLTATNIGAPTMLSFSDPSTTIAGAMQDLTGALNEVASELRSLTDPQSGDLARDSGARWLKQTFSALAGKVIMPGAADGAPRTLADLGLSTQRDGSFAFDPAKLQRALGQDPDGVAAMFTTGLYGIYGTIDSISRRASASGDPGTLAGSIKRYTDQKSRLGDEQEKLAAQQETMRARLVARFSVSESRVSASKSTLSFLQNQIDAWNSQNN